MKVEEMVCIMCPLGCRLMSNKKITVKLLFLEIDVHVELNTVNKRW